MLDHSSIISDVGSISEHDFDAVAVQIKDGSIEVTVFVATSGRGTVGATASGQGCCIEISNSRPTRSGECDVRGAGLYAMSFVSCGVPEDRRTSLPRRLLAQEEVRIANTKADLVARLSNISVPKGLKSG